MTWANTVSIDAGTRIEEEVVFKTDGSRAREAVIRLGRNCFVGTGTEFNISESIQIGDATLIASGCRFIDHDHGIEPGRLIGEQETISKPIRIGSDVWLGVNCVVLKGVTIGNGAVIGAGAVVTRDIPANSIAIGCPARVVRERGNSPSAGR